MQFDTLSCKYYQVLRVGRLGGFERWMLPPVLLQNRRLWKWRTGWTIVPVTQPCGQHEHRVKDLPTDEPQFLSYQLPWEFSESRRFYFRLKLNRRETKQGRKTEGRLADPGHFPWELHRLVSTHEIEVRKSLIFDENFHGKKDSMTNCSTNYAFAKNAAGQHAGARLLRCGRRMVGGWWMAKVHTTWSLVSAHGNQLKTSSYC